MRRISHKFAFATLLVLVGAGALVGNVLATPAGGLTQTVKGPYSFAPFDVRVQAMLPSWRVRLRARRQSDVYYVDNVFGPGATTGWHSHPGPSFILVVSGTVTNYEGGGGQCSITQYSAGQGFIDTGGNGTDIHMIKNNTTQPAETIALQVLPKGASRRIDEADPGTCPGQ